MLDFSKCSLYRLSSKKGLKYILHINDNKWFRQEFVSNYITPYIDHNQNRLAVRLNLSQIHLSVIFGKACRYSAPRVKRLLRNHIYL